LIICACEATAKIGAPLWRGAGCELLLILQSPLQNALGSTFWRAKTSMSSLQAFTP
jgi:hypothetical protein